MAGETEQIRYVMTVDGQQQTAAAFESAARSMAKSADALTQLSNKAKELPRNLKPSSDAANDNARAFENMASKAKSFTSVTSRLGSEMSTLGASALAMGASVGTAGTALSSMSRIIGGVGTGAAVGGVAGAIGGGLISVLSELVDMLGKTKTAEEELAEMVARTNEEFEKQYNSAAKITDRMRDADERRRLEDQRRGMTWKDFAESVTDPSKRDFSIGIKQEQEEFERIRSGYGEGAILEREGGKPGKRPDLGAEYDKRRQGVRDQLAHLYSLDSQPTLDERAEAGKSAIQAKRDEAEAQQRQFETHAAERAKLLDAETKRYGEIRDVGMEAYDAIGSTAANALSSIARGQKVTLKEVMGAIGTELVGKGVMWGFEGGAKLASSYGTDPAGWELLGLGAAAVAAGMGMGAAASSGSSNRGSVSRPRATPDDPHWQVDTAGGRSAPTYVINQQNLVGDARAGQEVVKAIQQAQRQGLVTGNGMAA